MSSSPVAHIRNFLPWFNKPKFKPNSVIIVTGAGSGIGKRVSTWYAARKCRLVLADINETNLEATVQECIRAGSQAIGVKTDVTNQASVQNLVDQCVTKFGAIDILVLCAGIAAHHLFQDTKDLGLFHKLMNVNFYGYLYCTKAAFEHLIKSKGVLVAVTSFSGEVGLPYRTAYCASKFAVTGFLEALRSELALVEKQTGAKGFDITLVCPPTINTNLRKNALTPDPKLRTSESSKAMSVDDCAAAIVDAADRRIRKAFFPWKATVGAYLRPLVPDLVDRSIRNSSSL